MLPLFLLHKYIGSLSKMSLTAQANIWVRSLIEGGPWGLDALKKHKARRLNILVLISRGMSYILIPSSALFVANNFSQSVFSLWTFLNRNLLLSNPFYFPFHAFLVLCNFLLLGLHFTLWPLGMYLLTVKSKGVDEDVIMREYYTTPNEGHCITYNFQKCQGIKIKY